MEKLVPTNTALIAKAQLDEQHKQANVVILGNTGIGALTGWFYWPITDQAFLVVWFATLFIIQVIRYVLAHKYLRTEHTEESGKRWLAIYAFGTLTTGLCWAALGCMLILNCEGEQLVILFLALIGLVGGNIATSAYRKRLFTAFSTPTLVPVGVLGFFGDQVSMTLGAMSIALWLLSWVAIRRLNDSLVNALTLGFENQELVQELGQEKKHLEETNQRLNRELQRKLSMTKWLASGPESYANADISNGNFNETLTDIWEISIEEQKPLSMVIFEIDNHGSETEGDDSKTLDKGLAKLQGMISSEIRGHDQYVKVNDSEYALILANMPATDATSLVNRIRNKLASLEKPLMLEDGSPITLSFGVAGWIPDVTQNASELVTACRNAKELSIEQGGNRVTIG